MEYKIGQKFTYIVNNGVVDTVEVVGYKYELSRQIKSSSKYLSETEMSAYVDKEILIPGEVSDRDLDIKMLEEKWGINLKVV